MSGTVREEREAPTGKLLTDGEHVSRRITDSLGKYHDALLRGRNPKSFTMKSSVFWQVLDASERRMKEIRDGRRFRSVCGEIVKKRHGGGSGREGEIGDGTTSPQMRRRASSNSVKLNQFLSRERRLSSVSSFGLPGSVDSRSVSSMGRRKRMASQLRKKFLANVTSPSKSKRTHAVLADKNSNAKVFFGSTVAFEQQSVQGPSLWLTLTPSGKFIVAPRDSGRGQYTFRLVDLENQSDQRPIHFGESCWLGISTGLGEKWQQGGVIATKMTHAVNLIEDKNRPDEKLGTPIPVPAYTPADFEHRIGRADHKERLERNVLPLAIGKWKLQPALRSQKHFNVPEESDVGKSGEHRHFPRHRRRHHHSTARPHGSTQLFNMAQIYMEQDWFVLTTEDTKAPSADASMLSGAMKPMARSDGIFLRKLTMTHDERDRNLVTASGIWTIYVVETQSVSAKSGPTSAVSKVENLLYRARMQLHRSKKQRDGEREYEKELRSGRKFPLQFRRLRQSGDEEQMRHFCEQQRSESLVHFARCRSKWSSPHRHLERVLKNHDQRTRFAPSAIDGNSTYAMSSMLSAPLSSSPPSLSSSSPMPGTATQSRSYGDEDARRRRRRERVALSEWFKKKCGADLRQIHEDIDREVRATRDEMNNASPGRHHLRSSGRMVHDEDGNSIDVEKSPIYRRLVEEDHRAARILEHRKRNPALVDLYATLFSDVHY